MDDGAVLALLPHAVVVVDDGRVSAANPAAQRLADAADGGALVGQRALDLVAEADRPRAAAALAALGDGAGTCPEPVRVRLAGSGQRWVAVLGTPAPGGAAVLAVTDLRGTRGERRRLAAQERRFRAAFAAGQHGAALVGERGRVVAVNDALAALLGRPAAELVGGHVAELLDSPSLLLLDRADPGSPRRLRAADGRTLEALVSTTPIPGAEEHLLLVQVQDVTERRRSEQRLRHLALHDELTDLPTRGLFLERLREALDRRTPAAPLVAVLFVDLDEFKLVNDALGHAVGDLVLREAAVRLRAGTRPQDTVARLSGDEFAVVCPALGTEAEALAIADRLGEALRSPVRTGADEVLVSASIGVAFTGPAGSGPEELVREADAAMYRAKQLGRRRYEVFDQALRERAAERSRVRDVLARAVAEDRVVVHYQPVVDTETGQAVAVEALLRVRDDDGALLAAAQVLDVASESGLLRALDDVVLRTAATAAAGWAAGAGRPLGLSVNLGASQVDAGLAERVAGVLAAAGLAPAQLTVEVTEQVLATAGPEGAARLRALQDSGVRVALDDFGTGRGSLTALRELPVQVLKVDRSFVALLPDADDGLVGAVVQLAGRLGLEATAEGVETQEQLAALRRLAPAYAQGALFGGPVPAEEVPRALARLGVPLAAPPGYEPG